MYQGTYGTISTLFKYNTGIHVVQFFNNVVQFFNNEGSSDQRIWNKYDNQCS